MIYLYRTVSRPRLLRFCYFMARIVILTWFGTRFGLQFMLFGALLLPPLVLVEGLSPSSSSSMSSSSVRSAWVSKPGSCLPRCCRPCVRSDPLSENSVMLVMRFYRVVPGLCSLLPVLFCFGSVFRIQTIQKMKREHDSLLGIF